jgi:hypothetical protein
LAPLTPPPAAFKGGLNLLHREKKNLQTGKEDDMKVAVLRIRNPGSDFEEKLTDR